MKREIKAGKLYELTNAGLVETTKQQQPTVWVCRRVADFPDGAIAALATPGFADCSRCQAAIVYNAARDVSAPKVCMQCLDIEPGAYK